MSWSLRGRLTTAIVGLVAIVLTALAVLLYVGVHRAAWKQRDDALAARAHALAAIAEHDDSGYEMSLPPEASGEATSYIEAWRPDGAVLARSASLHDGDLPPVGSGAIAFADLTLPDGRDGRAIELRFTPRDEARHTKVGTVRLVVAEGTESVDAAVHSVQTWFILLGIAALAIVALVTTWSLSRGLRPLAQLAREIETIDDRHLATRLSSADQPAELEVPVNKLNELLARLDRSFARERQFTADVSHELRTPLSGLRTLLEVTAIAERTTAEYQAALGEALEIALQLGALVENLLTLSRLDSERVTIQTTEVSLRALVEECWQPHAALAASRAIAFRNAMAEGAVLQTDREKLRVVVGNLLSNAAEYTEPGGWIEVTGSSRGGLEIADSGPPIPDDQLERIFDRLWRGDHARTASGVHCGIGLSLSRALCEAMSLSLVARSTEGRVAFEIAP